LRVLVLCDDGPGHAATVYDYLDAMQDRSRHEFVRFNPRRHDNRLLRFDTFDAVVVHWSLVLTLDVYVPPRIRAALRAYDGPKIQFIQDEYRWVDEMTAAMRDVGIDVVFSAIPSPAREQVYAERLPDVELHTTLTGFVPEALLRRPVAPIARRSTDIAYRGRPVPYSLGALGREKVAIAQNMQAAAEKAGLRHDIAWDEDSRIYGDRWIDFVASARATLGTESGASIVDFDRECELSVKAYLRERPGAPFEEVARDVLAPWEGNIVINVVSPRIFEAAALRTALVLHPGIYSGAVIADRHFIPLAKDFSNSDEVCERLRDARYLQDMADRTYEEVAMAPRWHFDAMVSELDEVIERLAGPPRDHGSTRFRAARLEHRARSLLALPQPPLTTRRGLRTKPARALATDAARTVFVTRGALASPAQRRLVRAAARACLKGHIRPRTALEDLLAVSLLADAASGRLAGYLFDIEFEPEGGPPQLITRAPASAGRADSAPRIGADDVHWRNAGARIFAPLLPGVTVEITVGEQYAASHDLSGLLAAVPRDAVQDVLDEAFARELGVPVTVRSLQDAGTNAAKAIAALRTLATHRVLLALAQSWHRMPADTRPGVDLLLDDVVKLTALREARAHGLGVAVEKQGDLLLLRSKATAKENADAQLPPDPWGEVRWDHSAVGAEIPMPGRSGHTAVIGTDGRYRFGALSRLSAEAPRAVADALRWALEPPRDP
jgi:hypothetical protein